MIAGASGPQFGERAEFGPDDVCYRHPDRHSFALCQRCGRTICHDCQHASPVGVLCPDCVKQNRPSGAERFSRGARASTRRLSDASTPVVTYALMAVCLVVFAAQLVSANFGDDSVTRSLWYAPLYSLPQLFEPWRMLTAMFTHSTGFLLHIAFNLFALWAFGRNLEQILGRGLFLLVYVLSGIGGSLTVMLWAYVDVASMQVATVGASGAIFGLFAATLLAVRAAHFNATSLMVLIGLNFAIGFLPGASISWQSHLGGMIVGAAVMGVILATRGPRMKGVRTASLIGVSAVLLVLMGLYFVAPPVIIGW